MPMRNDSSIPGDVDESEDCSHKHNELPHLPSQAQRYRWDSKANDPWSRRRRSRSAPRGCCQKCFSGRRHRRLPHQGPRRGSLPGAVERACLRRAALKNQRLQSRVCPTNVLYNSLGDVQRKRERRRTTSDRQRATFTILIPWWDHTLSGLSNAPDGARLHSTLSMAHQSTPHLTRMVASSGGYIMVAVLDSGTASSELTPKHQCSRKEGKWTSDKVVPPIVALCQGPGRDIVVVGNLHRLQIEP